MATQKMIFRNTWLHIRPAEKDARTDQYYINLSNRLKKRCFEVSEPAREEFSALTDDDYSELACFIAAYFEDIASETGIFQTFVRLNRKYSHKSLPFFDMSDYDEYLVDDINQPDIEFLIWYFLSIRFGFVVLPDSAFIIEAAALFFDELDSEWESAQVNADLQKQFTFHGAPNDFYEVRNYIQRLFFDNYLIRIGIRDYYNKRVEDAILAARQEAPSTDMAVLYVDDELDTMTWNLCSPLWGVNAATWACEYLRERGEICQNLHTLSRKIEGFFTITGEEEQTYQAQRLCNEEPLRIWKSSLLQDTSVVGKTLLCSVIRWRGQWFVPSLCAPASGDVQDINEDLQLRLKQSDIFSPDYHKKKDEEMQNLRDAFLKHFRKDLIFGSVKEIEKKASKFYDELYENDIPVGDAAHINDKQLSEALLFVDNYRGLVSESGWNEAFCEVACTEPLTMLEHFEAMLFNAKAPIGLVRRAVDTWEPQFDDIADGVIELFEDDFEFLAAFYKPESFEKELLPEMKF